jgi:hypothetical protein
MTKNLYIGALVVAFLVTLFAGYGLHSSGLLGAAGPGPTHYQAENFLQGLYAGVAGQFAVTNTGGVTASSLTVGTSGTALSKYVCGTATWNPGSVASSGAAVTAPNNATSVVVESSGSFVVGKPMIVSLSSATGTGRYAFSAYAHQTGSSTAVLVNNDIAAIDFATGTLSVCQLQ